MFAELFYFKRNQRIARAATRFDYAWHDTHRSGGRLDQTMARRRGERLGARSYCGTSWPRPQNYMASSCHEVLAQSETRRAEGASGASTSFKRQPGRGAGPQTRSDDQKTNGNHEVTAAMLKKKWAREGLDESDAETAE